MISISISPKNIKSSKYKSKEFFYFIFLIAYAYLIADPLSAYFDARGYQTSFTNTNGHIILFSVLVTPFIEELIFRTHLSGRREDKWSLPVMISVFLYIFFDVNLYVISLILVIGMASIIFFNKKVSMFFLDRYFNYTFLFTSLGFALAHFSIVDIEIVPIKILILLVSYLPISLYFGYIRKKYGLMWSIGAHSLNNFTLILFNTIIYA
jgi:hypothetical protein